MPEIAGGSASVQSAETERAGAIGGARVGRPKDFRMASVVVREWIAARMRIGLALQRGQRRTSTSNTRRINSDQL